ncbi:hypothetical protein Tco_0897482 [Tanacetum coccineum]
MNLTAASQITLDNALVPPEARLKIGKCNKRIEFSKPQREATYQVTLDALKLSSCYPAFLITAGVPEIYMNLFWNTVTKVKDSSSYQFKLDNKKFKVNAKEILRLYMNCSLITCINPGEHLQLSSTGAFLGKPLDLINLEMLNEDILVSTAYKTYYAYASGAKESKKERKKSQTGVIIKDTPGVSVSKKKAPAKGKRSKGIEILSPKGLDRWEDLGPMHLFDVALTEATQLKEVTKRSKKDFHISHSSGSGDGTDYETGVPDEQQRKIFGTDKGAEEKDDDEDDDEVDTKDESDNDGNDDDGDTVVNEDDGDNDGNDDDGDNDDNDDNSDHERIESDRDEIPNLNQSSTKYEEEEEEE